METSPEADVPHVQTPGHPTVQRNAQQDSEQERDRSMSQYAYLSSSMHVPSRGPRGAYRISRQPTNPSPPNPPPGVTPCPSLLDRPAARGPGRRDGGDDLAAASREQAVLGSMPLSPHAPPGVKRHNARNPAVAPIGSARLSPASEARRIHARVEAADHAPHRADGQASLPWRSNRSDGRARDRRLLPPRGAPRAPARRASLSDPAPVPRPAPLHAPRSRRWGRATEEDSPTRGDPPLPRAGSRDRENRS
jgi:hypothetical protein